MLSETELNVLVTNVLNGKKYSNCRLCLENIEEHYVRFNDLVTLDPESGYFQTLASVIIKLLGEEICNDIPGVEAVCTSCAISALNCVKFIEKCENATTLLNNVFDNLTEAFNINIDTEQDQSLYIVPGENESQLILVENKKEEKLRKKLSYACSDCDEIFNNLVELRSHNLTCHESIACEKCKATFSDKNELSIHEIERHKFQCPDCDQIRHTEESLKQHKDRVHNFKVPKNQCPKCGKSYTTKEFFLKHLKPCLEDRIEPHPMRSKIKKTYICKGCDKAYSTPGGLRVHQRFEHGNAKYHVCPYCDKKFTAPSYLKVHMIKHTGQKDFPCSICGGRFVSKEALLYHTRRHTGEKPYSCTMCDEKFVNASARAEHIKFKHVGPTLMCELCSRKFVTPSFLRQHIKKHHDPRNKIYHERSIVPANVPNEYNVRIKLPVED